MHLGTFLLFPIMIVNFVMGLIMLLRGKHAGVNRYFSISAFAVVVWALGSFLLLTSSDFLSAHIGLIMFYIAPIIATAFMPFFTKSFPRGASISTTGKIIIIFSSVAMGSTILLWPNLFTESLTITQGQNVMKVNSIGYSIYATYLSGMFLWSYINLWLSLKKSSGYRRSQIIFSFIGIFLTSFLAAATNLILPLFDITYFIWLGPSWAVFYVLFVGIAIVKYRLFDIRLVIARTIAYMISLLILIGLYALLAFFVASTFFPGETLSLERQVSYVAIALILALTFSPLKARFDKITKRIFYRDAYEMQDVLDRVSSTLVRTVSLDKLSHNVIEIIDDAIKPTQTSTVLLQSELDGNNELANILKSAKSYRSNMILVDELQDKSHHLYNKFRKLQIAVVAPLRTSGGTIGYLILSDKASGAIYNSQDVQLTKIVADGFAVAIQNSLRFEEIQNFNETLQDRVDAATKRLRRANERLKQLDATKDEFVSMASHQLRTPLTSIKGYLSMVLEGDAGKLNPTQAKLLKEAFTSSERMVRLIGDFLNVSRLRTGKFVIDRKTVNMADLIEGEVSQLKPTAVARELDLVYEKPKDFPDVELDKGKIQQVVMNFIDNAIFYSKPGGKITIELYKKQNDIIFKVKDEGIGVPADEKKRLFTKFFRASNARKQRPDGTGIGLFMAQKVIVAHGGAVIFESKEGEGSTFGFQLPIKLSKEDKERAEKVTNEMNLLGEN